MKKFVLFLAMTTLSSWGAQSQTPIYTENFESYTVGGHLAALNPTWWTTWSNAAGEDALIKSDFAHSPTKSLLIDSITGATNDMLLKLGGRTTGKYELDFWMYVESNKCGYYSILHAPPPSFESGMYIYFRTNGDGELFAGSGTAVAFTYPKSTWFKVKHLIDLDTDIIRLYINGILINEWPFSNKALSTGGTKTLANVDFFAGSRWSAPKERPRYYIDDIYFTQLNAISDPVAGVNPASLSAYIKPSSSDSRQITLSNSGTSFLDYNVNVIFGSAPPVIKSISMPNTLPAGYTVVSPLAGGDIPSSGSPLSGNATAILNYDSGDSTAIGWGTPPVTATVAARYPNALTLPYAGMSLDFVDIKISQLNATGNPMTLKIFGMGTMNEPGTLLRSQAFTPIAASWNKINLTTPLKVTGEDLWVGYQFTQTDAGIFIPGTDKGPNNPNGDFINTGSGWTHLSQNISLPYNWNIRANLSGDAIPHWLAVSPMSGTIAPAGSVALNIAIATTGLANGLYQSTIRILTDDPLHKQVDIPCTLSISVGINEAAKVAVMIYPNPAENLLHIVSNDRLLKVSVLSYNGKIIFTGNKETIDISNLSSGAYFLQTYTAKGISYFKFMKK